MKLIVKPVLIVMAFCICYCANAQISDSLYADWPARIKPVNPHSLSEKEKRLLVDSGYLIKDKFNKELDLLAEQLLKEADNSSDVKFKISNTLFAAHFKARTDMATAIRNFKTAARYCGDKEAYSPQLLETYFTIALIYNEDNMNDSAISYCFKVVDLARKLNDKKNLFNCYKLICDIYMVLGFYDKANHYNDITLGMLEKSDKSSEYVERKIFKMRCFKNLAAAKSNLNYADSAVQIANTIFLETRKDSMYYYSSVYLVLGQLNYEKGNYRKALDYYDSSMMKEYVTKARYFGGPWMQQFYKSICLIWFGNYKGVNRLLDSIPGTSYNLRRLIYEALYKRSAAVKNWRAAYSYYQDFIHNMEMMKVSESGNLLAEAMQQNTITEKQMQITALENSNLLKEKAQVRLVTGAVVTGMILLMAIVILTALYRNAQTKRYSERQLLTAELYRMEAAIHDERQLQLDNIAAQRKKIAEDMHDEVSSGMAAFRFYIIDLKSKAVQKETISILSELEAEAQVLYQQARDFMKNLNASKPADSYNVYDLAEQLSGKFSNERLLVIRNNIDRKGVEQYFTGPMHYELYLVIKETVANSIKHAGATLVDIAIYFKNHTCFFSINDNGKGFNVAAASNGLGLKSIANRIQTINGDIKVRSNNSGTVVEGFFPV